MQKDFLDTLGSEILRKPQDKYRKRPPVANEFALGYTYQDVLDGDQEGMKPGRNPIKCADYL